MSIILQVGEIREMRAVPGNFPKCGSWHYTEDVTSYDMCKNMLSNHGNNMSFCLVDLTLLLLSTVAIHIYMLL